jgi:ABC-type transport system involved in Fe-S cluster assembly fused permease/ATPase subunit
MLEDLQEQILVCCFSAVTLQLIRVAIDLVQQVSIAETKQQPKENGSAPVESTSTNEKGDDTSTTLLQKMNTSGKANYGAVAEETTKDAEELQPLLSPKLQRPVVPPNLLHFNRIWMLLYLVVSAVFVIVPWKFTTTTMFSYMLLYSTSFVALFDVYMILVDFPRQRYGFLQRFFHMTTTLLIWSVYALTFMEKKKQYTTTGAMDIIFLVTATVYLLLSVLEGWMISLFRSIVPLDESSERARRKKQHLSLSAIYILVKPYIWPDTMLLQYEDGQQKPKSFDSSVLANRLRAILTWVCVIVSKVCSIVSPLYLGWASTALAHAEYGKCIRYTILYNVISWLSTTFKEGQSLMYLKVKQAAFVQLSQTAFGHLHSLSLDWHLRKKLGEVLRSMDRGIAACDTLMNYLFLWLIPAIAECCIVCFLFAVYFQYAPLAISVFYFVFFYILWTIVLTVWRKKYRKALVLHDNEWHDRFTDSMINFETVKFFTAETYEMQRFAQAVSEYQAGSVNVQSSLSTLNISQQVILKLCLTAALSLAAMGIQQRVDCCVTEMGCDSGLSDCCRDVPQRICPGSTSSCFIVFFASVVVFWHYSPLTKTLSVFPNVTVQVGDFVAVLTYTLNLFAPLNFLGSVYNAIVMAVVDLSNMSELLAESPDVTDAPDAVTLPATNATDPNIAIEFDNVVFNYPTQPKERGLKGLSFTIQRGTTTAIVGPTGAGKTTVSRLLFRFYDVLGGAVKVNGVDVRALTQSSLRGAIGVVPQAASMFNDTIWSNIIYGRREASREEVLQAARDAQLLEFIESLDDGWETLVGDRGLKLSGGEKQRAAIARCLLKNPPFILLDEATASLDTLTENSVQVALDRLGAQRTVLVIAHRLGTSKCFVVVLYF